jgi:GrpB-like predicted nucleotidyltransferase (UPF0157 family)
VKVFRFDPEVSVPVSASGSEHRRHELARSNSEVEVGVVHVAPGGGIGRHQAEVRQLLAVVAGSGWVGRHEDGRSSPGSRRPLRAGYAALWEPGESWEAGSDDGFTGVSIEGVFEVLAAVVTQDILVQEYDPRWPGWFERVCELVWPTVAELALRIDHVGSTSVPGLAAKPIIDMDIVVATEEGVRPVIDRLATIGYRWRGDLGVVGRQAFDRPEGSDLPAHHLYLVVQDNKAHLDHWLLRDLLRADAAARTRYEDLKRHNVEVAGGDIDVYVAAKAALVAELLTRARAERGLPPASYWVPDTT